MIAKIKASAGLLGREDFIALNEGFNATAAPSAALQDPSAMLFKSASQEQHRVAQAIQSVDIVPHSQPTAPDHIVSQGAQNTAP